MTRGTCIVLFKKIKACIYCAFMGIVLLGFIYILSLVYTVYVYIYYHIYTIISKRKQYALLVFPNREY